MESEETERWVAPGTSRPVVGGDAFGRSSALNGRSSSVRLARYGPRRIRIGRSVPPADRSPRTGQRSKTMPDSDVLGSIGYGPGSVTSWIGAACERTRRGPATSTDLPRTNLVFFFLNVGYFQKFYVEISMTEFFSNKKKYSMTVDW